MFFVLSKTLNYLTQPLVIICACLVLSFLLKNQKWKKRLRVGSLIILLFFTNEFLAKEAARMWELPPIPLTELPQFEWGVLLSGVTKSDYGPDDRIYLTRGADRVTHTALLYKAGHIKKILVSGGSSELIKPTKREADEIRQALISMGVPDSVIIAENISRNTHESAVEVKKLLTPLTKPENCLLITSAFHMRRSRACFNKAGWPMAVFPAHFFASKRKFTPDVLLVPNPEALSVWHSLVREWVGIIAYKVAGYV